MKSQMQEAYLALLRNHFPAFIQRSFLALNPETEFLSNWHIGIIAAALEECRLGKTKRLIINLPPRSLKSHCVSVSFTAWLLGHKPNTQIICASHGQSLADDLALNTRAIINSEFYQEIFPTRLSKDRRSINDFKTTKQGTRLATSVGGALTGRGADFIIIDDPLKSDEALSDLQRNSVNDWYDNTLLSRLNSKTNGCIIIVMQRLHEDDLVGHVQKAGGWKLLRFPAIAEVEEQHTFPDIAGRLVTVSRQAGEALHPEREPLEILASIRATVGTYIFAGQYLQAPAPFGGGIVKLEWFQRYSVEELPKTFDLIFQSWDTANKVEDCNDFSVCTTWGLKDKNLYLLHVLRKKLEYPDLLRQVRIQAAEFKAENIVIEDRASGTQLLQQLKRDGLYGATGWTSSLEKQMRMETVTVTIENGFVYLPEKAPWLAEYEHELAIFPKGRYDDQVDSTSQALHWFKDKHYPYGLIKYCRQLEGAADPQSKMTYPASPFIRPSGYPR